MARKEGNEMFDLVATGLLIGIGLLTIASLVIMLLEFYETNNRNSYKRGYKDCLNDVEEALVEHSGKDYMKSDEIKSVIRSMGVI